MPDPPAFSNPPDGALARLRELLCRRLALIADAALRERDPGAQLDQLRLVSEEIAAFHEEHRRALPARLNHFLERASFQKALEFIDGAGS
jgi:hypothetical protein